MSDDAVFRKVEESNARVYLLEWKTSNRKFFYWMQEKTDEKDQENCQTINKFINNPNSGNTQEGGSGGGNFTSGGQVNSQQLYNILNRARQQHQGGRGSSGTTTTNTQGTSTTPNTTSNTSTTQGSGTNQTTTGETGETGGTGVQLSHLRSLLQRHKPSGPSLVDVMDPNELGLLGIFQNEDVLKALKEYLPEGNDSTSETFEANVRSPPFQQALKIFSYALRHSSDMGGILFSLDLDPNLAGPNTTIEEFLRALQEAVNQKRMDTEENK